MATLKYDALLQGPALQLAEGTSVELLRPIDAGHSSFEVKWRAPNGESATGRIASAALDFEMKEIEEHGMAVDADGLPLFQNLQVRYEGPSNLGLATGDTLIVCEPWYGPTQMECQCINNQPLPNTDGRVVVQKLLLRRG